MGSEGWKGARAAQPYQKRARFEHLSRGRGLENGLRKRAVGLERAWGEPFWTLVGWEFFWIRWDELDEIIL